MMDDEDDERPLLTRLLRDPWIGVADERAYAAFRIAFSIVAMANLLNLWPYREILFTSAGMVDGGSASAEGWQSQLSVFHYLSSYWSVTLYFLFSAAAILCLGLGVAARTAAILVFIWHLSFTYRATLGFTGWDHVLRAYSFLVMVSPLGRCWATRGKTLPKPVPNFGLSLMRLQVVVIYFQTVIIKFGDDYWLDGDFLSYFLLSHHARWPHPAIADMGIPLTLATYLALIIELAIPILLLIPRTRRLGIALGFSFHLLIAILGRSLSMFSLTMWMSYVAFIDPPALDRIARLSHRKTP